MLNICKFPQSIAGRVFETLV